MSKALSRWCLPLVLAVASVSLVACSSSIATSTTEAPLPAGPVPSKISRMVCSKEAQSHINSALGVTAKVSPPTYVDHVYSCNYVYPSGTMVLSGHELDSWNQVKASFAALKVSMGVSQNLGNLGQDGFQAKDGTVVVRKDYKILMVNPTGLPARFGVPPTSSASVAVTVADLILGCWAGD